MRARKHFGLRRSKRTQRRGKNASSFKNNLTPPTCNWSGNKDNRARRALWLWPTQYSARRYSSHSTPKFWAPLPPSPNPETRLWVWQSSSASNESNPIPHAALLAFQRGRARKWFSPEQLVPINALPLCGVHWHDFITSDKPRTSTTMLLRASWIYFDYSCLVIIIILELTWKSCFS